MKRVWKSLDYYVVLPLLILCALGLIMVYSTSSIVAVLKFSHIKMPIDYFLQKQAKLMLGGILLLLVFARVPYHVWYKRFFRLVTYIVVPAVLVAVLIKGTSANNAQSWLFGLQPGEFAKLGVILVLAGFYARRQETRTELWRGILLPWGYVGLVFLLIVVQPDLGTAMLIAGIFLVMTFCSGINPAKVVRRLLLLSPFLAYGGYLAYIYILPHLLTKVQMARITTMLNPFVSPEKEGYHLISSYIAIVSGGFSGLGLGNSIQKLGYLPEPHTDFIMAVVSEELGFLGVSIILGSLLLIILRAFRLAQLCKDPTGSMIAVGIGGMLGVQTIVNIGGITGLLPLTGVPVPFVSYGGSSLWVNFMAIGLLLNVSAAVKKQTVQQVQEQPQRPQLVVVK